MILTSLKNGTKNASEIYEFIASRPYSYTGSTVEYLDVLYDGSIESLRAELTYLRKHGYIKKTNAKRPFVYALTSSGERNQENPFRFMEVFTERVENEVKKIAASMKKEIQSKVDAEVERIKYDLNTANEIFIREKMHSIVMELMKNEDKFATAVQEEVKKMRVEPVTDKKIEKGSTLFLGWGNEVKLNCNRDPDKKTTVTLKVINGMPMLEY